jgi:hypothetical protein
MTATAGLLQEPQPGHIAHSALSAPFVTKPSYLDAVMFLAGTAAPAALKMPTATQRFEDSESPYETAYTVAFDTADTFANACKLQPKLQRQWPAYLRHGTAIAEEDDRVTEILTGLDPLRLGANKAVAVEVSH